MTKLTVLVKEPLNVYAAPIVFVEVPIVTLPATVKGIPSPVAPPVKV